MRPASDLRRGFRAGALAGLVVVAGNYLLELLAGMRPLPQLLQEPLLAHLPGPVFGFLIDTLQHAGKVLEEFGLIVALVVAGGVLGVLFVFGHRRWPAPYLGLAFGAAGWLITSGVLLPLSGDGFAGLGESPLTPLYWALLWSLWGVVVDAAFPPAARAVAGLEGRRRVLSMPLIAGGIGLAFLAYRLVPGWYRSIYLPPEAALAGPSPAITPVSMFYVVSKNFGDPVVARDSWALRVTGRVTNPLRLDYAAFTALPATTETVTMLCVSNDVGGPLISTGVFAGPSLRDLVAMAHPDGGAIAVGFKARDGYSESLPLSVVMSSPEILVAHTLDGAPLPDRHGFPARVLIPGRYGMKAPKWLDEIQLLTDQGGGYWEQQGWNREAVVKTFARFDTPRDQALVRRGTVALAGVAFAGLRGISAVQVSTDGGRTWSEATLGENPGKLAWTLWTHAWTPAAEGSYKLVVRAVDGNGTVQTATTAPSFPSGSSGWHAVRVDVSK